MKRFVSVLLVLAFCCSLLCGCERRSRFYYDDFDTGETAEATTQPIDLTAPVEYEELIPPLDEDADVLTFRYDEKYLDLYYEKLEEFKARALKDTNTDQLEILEIQLEELLIFLRSQQTIAMVLYNCNMKDAEASQLHLDMTDMITQLQEDTIEVYREIYNSDCALKEHIFEDYSENDIRELLDYNTEVKDIQQRYSEIVVEYQAMDEDQVENDIGTLYAELVSNYNKMAQIYGYDHYYAYAYDRVYSRDYSADQIAQMRSYAKTYLLPAYKKGIEIFNASYNDLSDRDKERISDFVFSNYDNTVYLDAYFEMLPEDVRTDMQTLFDGNAVFPTSADALPGAYTTTISGQPFCFFSRDNKVTDTVVHELGHYYGALYGDMGTVPLDLAETQSQGHEWLMTSCMEQQLETEAYACYLDYKLVSDMTTILVSIMVDEFEERVYTAEGVENFTTEDFDRIMDEVCQDYGGLEFVEENLADMKNYWRLVAIEHPVYYVSYAVSLIPSVNIFFIADQDWEAALQIYLGLTRDIEEEPTFLAALENAGLASPFKVDVYEAIAQRYSIHVETT